MTLQYRNTHRDYLVLFLLQNPDAENKAARDHYSQMAIWWTLLIFAIYVGIEAELLFASCVFAVALFYSLRQSIPYRRIYREALLSSTRNQPEKDISLVVSEEGLVETVDEIVSTVTWSSVKGYFLTSTHLLLELSSGLFAIIPLGEVRQGTENIGEFIKLLNERRIPNRTEQDASGKPATSP